MSKTISETAKNEAIKLRATFYNNIAVALVVGGAFVPYFAFLNRFVEEHQVPPPAAHAGAYAFMFSTNDLPRFGVALLIFLVALSAARSCRLKAQRLIETLT